ncbi:MAG: hypothetical protein V4450_17230 [Bacteroidota bacterium]
MRKIIQFSFILIAANVIFIRVSAQLPKALVFGNVSYASPLNTSFKNFCNYGIGYELGGGIGLGKTLLIGSVGQMRYHLPKQTAGGVVLFEEENLNVTPVKIGIRRYLLLGLFLNANMGIAIQQSKSPFLYEAGAGYKLGFLEIGAAYTGYKVGGLTNNSLLVKAGLAIKI